MAENLVEIRQTDVTFVFELAHTMTRSARCCDVHMARQAAQTDRSSARAQRAARGMGGKVLFGSPWRFSYDSTMTVKEVSFYTKTRRTDPPTHVPTDLPTD